MRQALVAAGSAALLILLAEPSFGVTLDLPADALTSVAGGTSNLPQSSVSLDIDLHSFSHEPSRIVGLTGHLRRALTPELTRNFDLFLFVSTARHGPYAQHMYVFEKKPNDRFVLSYDWPVSTGRGKTERDALGRLRRTVTPSGYYELDPQRLYADYRSRRWNEPMPHAMFFDGWHKGMRTGLAIHAADGKGIERLGSRASAGCVRLAPRDAATLFKLVKDHYAGFVPQLAYDPSSGSTRRDGSLMRDADGKLQFHTGYRVLVIVEDFAGNEVATQ